MISPGVFTRENDATFLQQGVQQISGVFIGPAKQGPAFTPTRVTSPAEYRKIFGHGNYYLDFAVTEYLKDAGSAYVVRILGEEGFATNAVELKYKASSPNAHTNIDEDILLALLAPTKKGGSSVLDVYVNPSTSKDEFAEFDLDVELSGGAVKSYRLSLNPASKNYITKIFGTSVDGARELYVHTNFKELHEQIAEYEYETSESGVGQEISVAFVADQIEFSGSKAVYSPASTPWVQSQDLLESQPSLTEKYNLFKFVTRSHGTSANTLYKIGIDSVKLPGSIPGTSYGSFSVVIRAFDDTDLNPKVLERFENLSLDPKSPRYIARVIGDSYYTYEDGVVQQHGKYDNSSEYVYVVINQEVELANEDGKNDLASLIPWGFANYSVPLDYATKLHHGLKTRITQAETDYEYNIFPGPLSNTTLANVPTDSRIYLGFDFDFSANLNLLKSIASDNDSAGDLKFDFNLSDIFEDSVSEYVQVSPSTENTPEVRTGTKASERKFILGFQGGFDGVSPEKKVNLGADISATNTQGYDCSSYDANGTKAYYKALDIMSNAEQYDINLVVIPGIINSLHPSVVKKAIEVCEARKDCFLVFDAVGASDNVAAAITSAKTINSNYAATYYPWIVMNDVYNNKKVEVPASVLIPRVYAFNDKVQAEWYAPAGLNRGGIPEAIKTVRPLKTSDRDALYEARINPIAHFPGGGVVVWGQKTLQALPSALDRINVRRMLIAIKKFIASTSRYFVHEPNTNETRLRWTNLVEPYLEFVQERQGVYAFIVKMDDSNNPSPVIDRNMLVGDIYIQPTRAAEFIRLNFNLVDSGASFSEG